MTPSIRDATIDDVPMLARLIRDSFRDVARRFGLTPENCPTHPSNCTEDWVTSQINKGARFYVLEDHGRPCGCVGIEQAGADLCTMKRLGVLPDHRRQGLGEALVRHSLDVARSLGAEQVEISVIHKFVELKAWYERLGFAVTKEAVALPHLPFTVTYMSLRLT
jgi:N-acetylglutamate synthase-like GNAT family acetyltransferase